MGTSVAALCLRTPHILKPPLPPPPPPPPPPPHPPPCNIYYTLTVSDT